MVPAHGIGSKLEDSIENVVIMVVIYALLT